MYPWRTQAVYIGSCCHANVGTIYVSIGCLPVYIRWEYCERLHNTVRLSVVMPLGLLNRTRFWNWVWVLWCDTPWFVGLYAIHKTGYEYFIVVIVINNELRNGTKEIVDEGGKLSKYPYLRLLYLRTWKYCISIECSNEFSWIKLK